MFRDLLSLPLSDEIVMAQLEAFKRRAPILYGVLGVNTTALAVTHIGIVSPALSIYVPAAIGLVMCARVAEWFRLRRQVVTPELARTTLRKMMWLATAQAAVLLAWSCSLYNSSHIYEPVIHGIGPRGQAVLYVGLTVICCISLLIHARNSALLITLITILPFCAYLLFDGSFVERAVAVNLLLVAAGMLYVLFAYSKEFQELIRSKSELRELSRYQAYLANTDTLTGLSNRRQFFDRYEQILAAGEPFALIMIDLDRFKQVNDLHGHVVGDQVLVEIGARLRTALADQCCLARIGGDEFAVIHGEVQADRLAAIGEGLVRTCSEPMVLRDLVVEVGASAGIGIVGEGEGGDRPYSRIEQADYALSFVKQNGRGGVQIFCPEHEKLVRRHGEIEQALRAADLRSEINLVYQPVVASASGQTVGFEALARWNSPALGHVSPADFVPVAERSGLIEPVTLVVVQKALAQASAWPDRIRLKINLSARDISSPAQLLRIVAAVQRSGVKPSRLTFELTETALGHELDVIRGSVDMIKAMGASLAIDDFGTGYSSLSYVHRLNPDLIKIDRSFVARVCDRDGSRAIIKTIIELCRNVGARSLAEGVETAQQAQVLREMGIDELQGYHFGRPVTPDLIQIDQPARLNA